MGKGRPGINTRYGINGYTQSEVITVYSCPSPPYDGGQTVTTDKAFILDSDAEKTTNMPVDVEFVIQFLGRLGLDERKYVFAHFCPGCGQSRKDCECVR